MIRLATCALLVTMVAAGQGPARTRAATARPAASRPPAGRSGTARPSVARPPAHGSARATSPGKRVVVIDAGHGGNQPGMRARLTDGTGVDEKVITLGIARRVADLLKKRGVEVVMTRDRDEYVGLY